MKLQRKALVRSLVIAMVVADGVGIYFLQDRLSNPLQDSNAAFEEEALALAASEAADPKAQAPQQALAGRELPMPAFGMPEAAPAVAAMPVAAQSTALQTTVTPALASVLAKAPATSSVATPAAKPAAKAASAPALTAKRTIAVPRIAAVTSNTAPVTFSVTPSSKVAKAQERKRASLAKVTGTKSIGFTKAFGVSRAAPALAVNSTYGSLSQGAPGITADFTPDATMPQVETMETVPVAVASQPQVMTDMAPTVSAQSDAASVVLTPTGE